MHNETIKRILNCYKLLNDSLSHCTDVFLISPSIDVTDVTMNGSRLAAPGAGKSLTVSMSPCQVSVSYALHALYVVSAALSSLHVTMLH